MIEGFVMDTDVLVAAACSPKGASFQLLKGVVEARARPAISVPLFVEYESSLMSPRIQELHRLSKDDIESLLDVFAKHAKPVELHFLWRPQLSDAADEMVLETAVNAAATVIVTFNSRDFLPAAGLFGVEIVAPGEFLRRHRRQLVD